MVLVRRATALLGVSGVLFLSACTSDDSVSSLSELSHIHNLVVEGDQVFIGSHEGLFTEAEQGKFSRVGNKFDVMALASVDGVLLASGHPGEGFELPEPLGLISSTDLGTTWSTTSLTGDVDFHLLEASGATVIGVAANYDLLIKSSDSGLNWVTLDVPGFTDLGIDPNDENSVWLLTPEGLQRSRDGGSSFTLRTTSVQPEHMDWSETALYAATTDAVWVWDSSDEDWAVLKSGLANISALAAGEDFIAVLVGKELLKIPLR